MPPIDTDLTRIRLGSAPGGTFSIIAYVRSFELTEGEEGGGITKYFGGELNKAGDLTLEGSMPVLFDRADTTGQEAMRAAKRGGYHVWFQFCPAGTTAGSVCEQFQATVTEVSVSSARDDDWVAGSFSFRGVPSTLTTITLV
jgi:hypothetical protein